MTGQCVPRQNLSPSQRVRMYDLLQAHFHGVEREQFDRDLDEKNWVILLTDRQGALRGFSTLLLYTAEVLGEPATIVYSGDTIVHREAWGSSALMRTWIASVHQIAQSLHHPRIYWLLITSGFRTYRFLPVFVRTFYPRFDCPTPPAIQNAIDTIAADRFGRSYNPATGIVRLAHPQPLREGLRDIPPSRRTDPHVAHFLHNNPGHSLGDELVCLADISPGGLTPAGQRMVHLGRSSCTLPPP